MRPDKHKLAKEWIYGEATPMEEAKATWEAMDTEFNENRRMQLAEGGRLGFDKGGGADKYITPLKRKFNGQKFISVPNPTYSDGRQRVKTKAYEKFLKEQHAIPKPDDLYKRTVRPELDNYLIEIAEAMQKADNTQDFEYLMRNKEATKKLEKQQAGSREKAGKKVYKQKIYPKGMLSLEAIKVLENLESDPVNLKIIADSLGEDTDWVLEILDERNQYVEDVKRERSLAKDDPKYKKPRNDYLKVENWLQKNASKYSTPEAFEKALIRRFGNQNQFVIDMKKGGMISSTYFSDDFKKTMLNSDPGSPVKSSHLKQLIKSSLYNFNPKIKNAITAEIKNIFNSENLPKLRTEARKMLNNNKLLSMFDLNKTITGPFAKVIQAEIGQQLWNDINNFKRPRVGTQEMLKAFEQIVADEFKPIFAESAKAIAFSKENQWPKAKKAFGIADKIAWDHKIPSSLIDKGYADIIEYTKVNPTTAGFNARIKNAKFDQPLGRLIVKFENANTLDAKAKIKNKMDVLKNDFSKTYGGYLDEVNIDLDKKGNLKFSSSAKPLTMKDDRIAMLGKSIVQEGKLTDKKLSKILQDFEKYGCGKAAGGRILFADGSPFGKVTKCADKGIARFLNDVKTGNYTEATKRIFRSGGNLLKGILNPMELLKLRNYFGPAALGFMAAFEAGVITDDVFRMGRPLNESLASNWLTKSFTPYSLRHAEISNLLKSNKLPSNMLQYAKDAVKFEEAKKEMQRIESLQGTRVIDGSGYGLIDGTSVYPQEQEAKDVKGVEDMFKNIKDLSVIMPGSAKEMELQRALTEKSATEMAKKGFSPFFGFGGLKDRNQQVVFDDYMSPVEIPKDLRPVTYLDQINYKDQPLPSSIRQRYENFFSSPEGGNYLKPRQSLSELKYKDTNILDELTKDYNQAQRIKLASQLPGFYGTQDDREFMEGGIASLNVKKK